MRSKIDHRVPLKWDKISITAPQFIADEIAAFLGALCESGVQTMTGPSNGLSDNQECIVGYLVHDDYRTQKIERLHDFLAIHAKHLPPESPFQISIEPIVEEDWNAAWKQHFKPIKLTDRLVVKPSWEDYRPEDDELQLILDPGMAFGTGHHGSTQLVLKAIEKTYADQPPPQTVLDVGTGTGILGMYCALLGAKEVVGIDNDPDAVAAAEENIRINSLQHCMKVSIDALGTLGRQFDLVLANITHNTILRLADDLYRALHTGSVLILSGILKGDQEKNIIQTFQEKSLKNTLCEYQDEWTALGFALRESDQSNSRA